MKAIDIVNQLIAASPLYTSRLTNSLAVASMSYDADTNLVTVVTTVPHGLVNGRNIVITGAVSPVPVTSLTWLNGVVSGTTSVAHDLTEGWQEKLSITGATPSAYNGDFSNFESPNRTHFKYPLPVDPGTSPATGDIFLFDGKDRGYNGLHAITAVDETTFTFTPNQVPPAQPLGTPTVHVSFRIAMSATIDRFMQVYSKQASVNDVWLCVVLGDTQASNSRQIQTDVTDIYTRGTEYRQNVMERFSIFAVLKTTDELAGALARDSIEDIKLPLFKSILGVKFPSYVSINTPFGTVFVGSRIHQYSDAYYIQELQFEQMLQVVQTDVGDYQPTVAFRDINLLFQNGEGSVIMTTDVNLDDQPE